MFTRPIRPHPSPWRRQCRGMLVGLTSLALALAGTASVAAAQDDPADTESQVLEEPVVDGDTAPEEGADAAAEDTEASVEEGTVAGEPAAENAAVETDAEPAADADAEPAVEADAGRAVEAPDTDAAEEPAGDVAPASTPEAAAPAVEPAEEADRDFGVLAVGIPEEEPGDGEVKLIIRAGGDRTGTGETSQAVSPLAGVTYRFFHTTDGSLTGGTEVPEDCTTDATGTCGVITALPEEGPHYYYAVAVEGPEGWTAPTEWGDPGDDAFLFRFSTDEIEEGGTPEERTITLPLPFNATVTEPTWANIRDNNPLPPQCGLDMAIIADLSNSITYQNEGVFDLVKEQGVNFVEALVGTPSRVALHTFASTAPAAGEANGPLPLTSVGTAAEAQPIIDHIEGFTQTPTEELGWTNWDRAFHQIVESPESDEYDVVVFVTDGQPTYHRNQPTTEPGPPSVATIVEVNEAIHSANAVKALPNSPAVLGVGIGPLAALPGAPVRLAAVSGPEEGTDFFRAEFEELAETLRAIALENCEGTLTVVKEVETAAGEVVPGGPGWEFSTQTTRVTPVSAVTDDTSTVNFAVDFNEDDYDGEEFARDITVTETQQDGYSLVQVDGDNAVCVDTSTEPATPLTVTNAGDLGFTVEVTAESIVSCTVRNAQDEVPAMTVDKTARSADQLPDGTWEVGYDVTVTNTSGVDGTYDLTDTIEFGEGITPLEASWSLEGSDETGEWEDLPDELTATLATGRELAAGASETYTVTVVADVAAGVIQGETGEGQCTGEDGTDGGGFLNAATVTFEDQSVTDRDCLEPTHQTFEKTFESALRQPDGTWDVSYTIEVDNSANTARIYYDLLDVPSFAEGVTILDQEVQDVSDPDAPEDIEWDGESPIAEGVVIEGGEVQRYALTFNVRVAGDIPAENLVCAPQGPGYGFFNAAELHSGNDVLADDACGPIEETPPPTTPPEEPTPPAQPPRRPQLPVTGMELAGVGLLAALLSLGGISLVNRRRKES